MSLEAGKPLGYEVHIDSEKKLSIKIVRNSSGTVEIPELGVLLEPGPYSEGFFTNMEGLLERVEGVLKIFLHSENKSQKEEAQKVMKKLLRCKAGKRSFTVRVLDPFGGSALIGENVKRFELSKNEAEKLKKGISFL